MLESMYKLYQEGFLDKNLGEYILISNNQGEIIEKIKESGKNEWFNNGKVSSILQTIWTYFQGSEIYGGLANTWDYGPVGAELKNNIKKAWWQNSSKKTKTM